MNAPAVDTPRRSFVDQVMGMPVSVLVRGPAARTDELADVVARVHAELHEVDRRFSTWRPDSAVSRLRRQELPPDDVPADVQEVLRRCDDARQRTGGWFDASLPDADGVRRTDPTGLVKGWAVERAARHLAALEGHDWLVNAGGDVVAQARYGAPWRVGVEDPRDRSRVLARLPLVSGGVATSGSAARGPHVVDPRTGAPAAALLSATVVGPSLCEADVQATAAFAQGPASIERLEALPGYEALLVHLDGHVARTTGPSTAAPDAVRPAAGAR